jgi:hypothetical protein
MFPTKKFFLIFLYNKKIKKLEQYALLLGLTQLEVRIYEQAFLNFYLPSLNSTYTVVFGFVNAARSEVDNTDSPTGRRPKKGQSSNYELDGPRSAAHPAETARGGVPIEVYSSNYQLIAARGNTLTRAAQANFPTKSSCSIGLGISITTLNRYINMNSLVERAP